MDGNYSPLNLKSKASVKDLGKHFRWISDYLKRTEELGEVSPLGFNSYQRLESILLR